MDLHSGLMDYEVEIGDFQRDRSRLWWERTEDVQQGSIDYELIESIGSFFELGLDPGGLAIQIIQNLPFADLRTNCHQVVGDKELVRGVTYVHRYLHVERNGNDIGVFPGRVWKHWHDDRVRRAKGFKD